MDWILYMLAATSGVATLIWVTYLLSKLYELISETITHIRWRTYAEKELSELRSRIGEIEKKVLGSNED